MSSPSNALNPDHLMVDRTSDPSDPERLWQKYTLAISFAAVIGLGTVWGVIYGLYGAWVPVAIEAVGLTLFGVSLIRVLAKDDVDLGWRVVRWGSVPFTILMSMALGGYREAGGILWWGLLLLVGSAVFDTERQSRITVSISLTLIALSILFNPWVEWSNPVPNRVMDMAMLTNFLGIGLTVFGTLRFYMRQRNQALSLLTMEQKRSDELLLNVLPAQIAVRLKETSEPIADQCEDVSVLFADVVGFTPMSELLSPRESVDLLNQVFSHFDELALRHGVEKIRTIGDGYMAAAGIPVERPDHAIALVEMALEMRAYMAARPADAPPLQIRIGINSGPAVAGIIGTTKFHYDLWGDMVNVAARMESHGEPGEIQITRATYERIQDQFICRPRGLIEVKGKGSMETWFVEAKDA